ncbi:MAG: signal peptidase I [Spartobacteria bacterium]|nr:signal peptidase I [Spartobacteria bacterium]
MNADTGGISIFLIVQLALVLVVLVGQWKVFEKAGKPGWACIIPIYNIYVLLQIAGKPGWWLLLMFIPLVNIVIAVMMLSGVSAAFGKGLGFTLGLLFLPFIFVLILGFGDAVYQGADTAVY